MSMPDRTWHERAACRDRDAETFFCVDPESVRQALDLCAQCAVRDTCRAQALARREMFGVWGGMTETERRRIFRRERRRDTAA
jgi:WhiB family transcriptional regulator, redox-sensing transcriptional regulator